MSTLIWPNNHLPVNNDISSRCCLVTGGGRGIGRAVVLALAEAGVQFIAVNYNKDSVSANETCEAAKTKARNPKFSCVPFQCDVSCPEQVTVLIKSIVDTFHVPVTILVNNAGQIRMKPMEELTATDFDYVMNTNSKSAFLVSQACISGMKDERFGRIITISSMASYNGGSSLNLIYAMSKASLIGLINTYATVLHSFGITSNGVSPGLIETDMVTKNATLYAESAGPHFRAMATMSRMGLPEECANVAVMLAKTGYINGQIIEVDGGIVRSK